MAYDFPSSPTVGQIFQGWTWDGEKWLQTLATPNAGGVISIQRFTQSGTYTPSASMVTAVIECVGGGGGGAGTGGGATTNAWIGGGGGAGGYSRKLVTAAVIGASQPVTIGAAGTAGPGATSPTGNGGAGGDTSVGTLCSAKGGSGGVGGGPSTGGTPGGAIGTGDVTLPGATGGSAAGYVALSGTDPIAMGGIGANSGFGGGGSGGNSYNGVAAGGAASGYGSGGGGASSQKSTATAVGGVGAPGLVVITEYGITTLGSSANAAGAVRFDVAQGLTANQMAQARSNIYAAPFDALNNGIQINGGMEVSQELGYSASASVATGTAKYAADGWLVLPNGLTVTVYSSAPTACPGYLYQTGFAVATARPSPAATDYLFMSQRVEGWRSGRLQWGTPNAQPVSIAFWVWGARPGTYSGSINNFDSSRSYPFTFTISAGSTWEYKTVTIPGCTDGTWKKDSTVGFTLNFCFMIGTTYAGPANAWAATNYVGAIGTTNGAAATSDAFYLTGVVILPGIELPSAARSALIMRPYDQELQTCMRYFVQSWGSGAYSPSGAPGFIGLPLGPAGAPQAIGSAQFPVVMRAVPTLAIYDDAGTAGTASQPGSANGIAATVPGVTTTGFRQINRTTGNFVAAFNVTAGYRADARL